MFAPHKRGVYIGVVSMIFLLAMVTLLVGKSLHMYHHATCCSKHRIEVQTSNESSSGSNSTNNHDCIICHFDISPYVESGDIVLPFLVVLLASIITIYQEQSAVATLSLRHSRAPPISIF